jgi:hypothetical protein
MGIGIQSLVRRLPVLIGPIAGSLRMDRYGLTSGVHAGIAISILLATGALFLRSSIQVDEVPGLRTGGGFLRVLRNFGPDLRRLLLSDILIRFCERIPFACVVIYAMDIRKVSATQVGVLIAVETIAAIACYVPAAWPADKYGKSPS